jgi:hypothetical protein
LSFHHRGNFVRPSLGQVCHVPDEEEAEELRGLLKSQTVLSEDGEIIFQWKVLKPSKNCQKRVSGYLFVPVYQTSTIRVLTYSGLTLNAMARLFPPQRRGKSMIHTYPEWLSSRLVGPGLDSESDEWLLWKIMQMAKRRITHAREALDLSKVRPQQIYQIANHT